MGCELRERTGIVDTAGEILASLGDVDADDGRVRPHHVLGVVACVGEPTPDRDVTEASWSPWSSIRDEPRPISARVDRLALHAAAVRAPR